MLKRLTCVMSSSIDVYVDIPEHLIETFEKYDEFDSWEPSSKPDKNECEELYEIINDKICRDMDSLLWETIEIVDSEDIEDEN
jgi:hypothetical protein